MKKSPRLRGRSGMERRRQRVAGEGRESEEISRVLERLREDLTFFIHEVRTPLTAVMSSADILKRHRQTAKTREFLLDTIEKEARRINLLLEDFFNAYHQDWTWLSSLEISPVQVGPLLQEAAERFRLRLPRHCVRPLPPSEVPPVLADKVKIELVLRNLIANAVKYSPQGGEILLSAEAKGADIVFCVQDEGIGIPEESLERIFDLSFRVDRPEGSTMPGAGLGLAIVRRIVSNHGGRVWAQSRPEGGSCVFFSLPATADSSNRSD